MDTDRIAERANKAITAAHEVLNEAETADRELTVKEAQMCQRAVDTHVQYQASRLGTEKDAEGLPALPLVGARSLDLRSAAKGYIDAASGRSGLNDAARSLNTSQSFAANAVEGYGVLVPWGWANGELTSRADVTSVVSNVGDGPLTWSSAHLAVRKPLIAMSLDARTTNIGVGRTSINYVSSVPAASTVAETTKVDSQLFSIADREMKPKRVSASVHLTTESMSLVGDAQMTAIMELEASILDQIDEQIWNGSGTAPDETGVLGALAPPSDTPTAAATFPVAASLADEAIDGIYAEDTSDVVVFIGPATATYMAGLLRDGTDMSALEVLRRRAREVKVTARMPAAASDVQAYVTYAARQGTVVDVVRWNAMGLTVDPYTRAQEGITKITATALIAVNVEVASGVRSALRRGKIKIA